MAASRELNAAGLDGPLTIAPPSLQFGLATVQDHTVELWRWVVFIFASLIIPIGFLMIPFSIGCGGNDETKVNFWSFVGACSIVSISMAQWLYWSLAGTAVVPCSRLSALVPLVSSIMFVIALVACHWAGNDALALELGIKYTATLPSGFMIAFFVSSALASYCASYCKHRHGPQETYELTTFENGREQALEGLKSLASIEKTSGGSQWPKRLCSQPKQWSMVLVSFLVYSIGFYFILFQIQEIAKEANVGITTYIRFVVTATVWKSALKYQGFIQDTWKTGEFSCFYTGEVGGNMVYFVYYRIMFKQITTWPRFAQVQCLSLIMEWIFHPLRGTSWYYRCVRAATNKSPNCLKRLLNFVLLTNQPNVEENDWSCFVALDTSVRSYIQIFTLAYFIWEEAWCRFGYNQGIFSHFFDDDQYSRSLMQCVLQLIIEMISIVLMELWFRRQLGPAGAMNRLGGLLRSNLLLFSLIWQFNTIATPYLLLFADVKGFCA